MTEILYSRGENPDYTSAVVQPRTATLMTMAGEIHARLANCAADRGIVLPPRRLTYMTTVPIDCEQVAVAFGGWVIDPPSEGMTMCMRFRWCAQFGVAIGRCTPAIPTRAGQAPSVEKMDAAAQIASDDAELLLQLVSTFGEVGSDLAVNTPEPEGGFQAVLLTVTLPAFGGLD